GGGGGGGGGGRVARSGSGGPPATPSCSTSHPARARTWWRAAASATVLAPWPPVVNPNEAPAGRPSRSLSQAPATSSTAAAAGEVTWLNAGWSQPAVSTAAAVAASRAPPPTKPK